MQEISICPEDIQYAREKAIEMGRINNSITKGEGNIAGFLGEIIVSNLLTSVGIKNKVHNTYNYDIVCNDITIDVKTKRTKMKPRDYYECSIAKTSTHQKCTHYVFTRILNDFSKAWILGWMEHAEYFKKARFLKKGDKDGDNNFIVKADCYNVSIEDLNNISELGTKTVDTLNQVVHTDGVVVVDKHNINSRNGVALNTRKINMPIQPLYLTGKCYWAAVVEPNSTFEPAWQVDLCLDADSKALVEGAGLNVRNKEDERGEFVTLKRKVQGKNGPRSAPTVVDSQNNPWDKKLIGNGSVVTVKALPFEWNYAGKSGVSADLAAVQVVELVEYGDKGFDVVEGGYVNDAASQMADLESDDIPFGN